MSGANNTNLVFLATEFSIMEFLFLSDYVWKSRKNKEYFELWTVVILKLGFLLQNVTDRQTHTHTHKNRK